MLLRTGFGIPDRILLAAEDVLRCLYSFENHVWKCVAVLC